MFDTSKMVDSVKGTGLVQAERSLLNLMQDMFCCCGIIEKDRALT